MRVLIHTLCVGTLVASQIHAQERRTFKANEQIPAKELATNKTALSLDLNDDLTLCTTQEDALGYRHYRYQQTYKDIPVEGAIYLMHEKNNRVKHANGQLIRRLNLPTTPTISQAAALQAALAHINATRYAWDDPTHEQQVKYIKKNPNATFYPSGKLVIVDPTFGQKATNYRLAYKFDIYAMQPHTRQIVYVDAMNGNILKTLEKIHNCTGTLTSDDTNYSGTPTFTVCDDTLKSEVEGTTMQVFNADSIHNNSETSFIASGGSFHDPEAVEVQWAIEKTHRYFLDSFSRKSLDGDNMPIVSWVHALFSGESPNNASWNGAWMSYGDGDGIQYNSLTSPDVVAHEMTHGITDFSANLIYLNESGALNESFSDIFGEVIERHIRGSNDWLIGADFIVPTTGKTCIRNMRNPKDSNALTQQPNTYFGQYWHTDADDCGGVHFNSGVQNHWFYLLSEGGSGTNDNGDNYNVSAIGMDKAAAIAYYTLTTYLTPTSQYAGTRVHSIQAAQELQIEGVLTELDVEQVAEAWNAVGVYEEWTTRQRDSLVLVALYNATDGANWLNPWDLTQPMDTWDGVVSLNEEGRVLHIDLGYRGLTGVIPPEFGSLDSLIHLELHNNNLSDSIPSELGNLGSLEYWEMQKNNLSGIILPELGNLNSLTYLDLSVNQFSGNIPPELSNLNSLIYLNLGVNQLTGTIPPELGNLSNLEVVGLHVNQLSGHLPPEIGNLSNLTFLNVRHNALNGRIPSEIENLTNLTELRAYDCQFSGKLPSAIGNMSSLEILRLYSNELSSNIPPEIGNLTNLRILELNNNYFFGDIPSQLGNLTNLTELRIGNNGLTGSIPPEFGNLNNLLLLEIQNNRLNGCYDSNLSNLCTQLTDSNFDGNTDISDGNNFSATWDEFCTGVGICNLYSSCRQSDSLALVDIYNANNGASLTWDLNQAMNTWGDEVTLSGDGCVSELNLTGENLTTLPASIGSLAGLNYLNLSNNLLIALPPEVGTLTNLNTLVLNDNSLTSLPDELTNLTDLSGLHLANNNFTTFPTQIGSLVNLDLLGLIGNNLATLTSDIGNLTNLTRLDLNDNQLTSLPAEIGNLTKLDNLYLYNNNLTALPPEIGNLTKLYYISLSNNNLETLPPEFGNLITLNSLFLESSNNFMSLPDEIGNLTYLVHLEIENNQLTELPASMGGLVNLKTLRLGSSQLATLPSSIWTLPKLEELDLEDNNIDTLLSEVINLPSLNDLDLRNNGLTGCFYADFASLCDISVLIDEGNSLDTTWIEFCEEGEGICPILTCRERDSLALVELYNSTDGANWINTWDLSQPIDTWSGLAFDGNGCVRTLYLEGNNLDGPIPVELGDMTGLTRIYLQNNLLTGTIPAEIGNLTALTDLRLYSNSLTGNIPPEIGNLINLDRLFLGDNQLEGTIPAEIGDLTKLITINLQHNDLTGNFPTEFSNLINLREIWAQQNDFSGNLPEAMWSLTKLEKIYLWGNDFTGNISPSIGNLTALRELVIGNQNLTGEIPSELGDLGYLSTLNLGGTQLSGCYDPNLTNLCSQLNSLQYVNVDGVSFEDFCFGGAGACPNDFVLPGDFNADGHAYIEDILYWGLAVGNTGPLRPNASLDWFPQPCPEWGEFVNGVNNKHQDGNGDGTVDNQDLAALIQNYDTTYNSDASMFPMLLTAVNYELRSDTIIVTADSTTHYYQLYVINADSLHGVACSIVFDDMKVDSIQVDITGSSLEPDTSLYQFIESENRLDLALTRTDGQDGALSDTIPVAGLVVVSHDTQVVDPICITLCGQTMSADGSTAYIGNTTNLVYVPACPPKQVMSSDSIPSGDSVQYRATDMIKLDTGFTMQPGASLNAEVGPCDNQ